MSEFNGSIAFYYRFSRLTFDFLTDVTKGGGKLVELSLVEISYLKFQNKTDNILGVWCRKAPLHANKTNAYRTESFGNFFYYNNKRYMSTTAYMLGDTTKLEKLKNFRKTVSELDEIRSLSAVFFTSTIFNKGTKG